MAAEEIDANVLENLAAKVDGLDLTDKETAVLNNVLARATSVDPEVEGFGVVFEVETTFKFTQEMELTGKATSWGRAMGFQIHTNPGRYIGETEKH